MNLIFNLSWWFAIPFLVAKLLILVSLFFFHSKELKLVDIPIVRQKAIDYFPKFFNHKIDTLKTKVTIKSTVKLGDITLKAIYLSKTQKFIMIEDKKDILFITLNQRYKDVKLVDIGINFAIFRRDMKQIKLYIQEDKKDKIQKYTYRKSTSIESKSESNNRYISIQRDYFKKYTKNINSFFRDIRIKELRDKDGFIGIKIAFVRRDSLFDKMGLKRGDIIKEIDHKKLKNMKEVFSYYQRLKNITALQIGLQRGEDMKEIIYEID